MMMMMSFSCGQDEEPAAIYNPSSKRCKCLRDAFSDCRTFRGKLCSSPSSSSPEEDHDHHHLPSTHDFDDEEVFVSVVISKYVESKAKRVTADSFSWALSPETRQLFNMQPKRNNVEEAIMDDFFSAQSELSRCSSVTGGIIEPFASAKSTFSLSRSSSLSRIIEFEDVLQQQQRRRLMIIEELSHCQGWPFGLCKKSVLLLPPLPKSPSDSWLWRKPSTRLVRTR